MTDDVVVEVARELDINYTWDLTLLAAMGDSETLAARRSEVFPANSQTHPFTRKIRSRLRAREGRGARERGQRHPGVQGWPARTWSLGKTRVVVSRCMSQSMRSPVVRRLFPIQGRPSAHRVSFVTCRRT